MEKLVVYTQPISPITEAYRALCTNVLAGLGEKKLIEVVGVSANTDSSIVIANLAVAIAQAGKHVLILDCNFRNPKQHTWFGLTNSGITEYLASAGSFADYVQQTAQQNLQVFTAGTSPMNPVETLLSSAMESLLLEAKTVYDIILIDVPPVCDVADAPALGAKVDGVLLVLTNKVDKVEQAQKAKSFFDQVSVPVVGCVFDKA